MSVIQPSFEAFRELATRNAVVPVFSEVLADTWTPVGAVARVRHRPGSYLFESVVGGEKWARYSFVGFDPAVIVRGAGNRFELERNGEVEQITGVDPWARLRDELSLWKAEPHPDLPRFWGGAVGYVAYDAVRRFEPTVAPLIESEGSYEFSFALGGTVLIFDSLRQTMRTVVPVRIGQEPVDQAYERAQERIAAARNLLAHPLTLTELEPPRPHLTERAKTFSLPPSSFDEATFCAAVEKAQEYIRAGDIFQVVPSQRFRIPKSDVDLFDVYRAMRALNPSPYMYFLRLPEVTIAGASPETLVRLEDGRAEVRPIAGTRRRGRTAEEDEALEREMLADPKEVAEHVMLVDLGRNDLGRISKPGSVRITDKLVTERYSHVMHIASNVGGDLAEGKDALDVLRATFPAGTLSGAPKVRAMQIIDELEPEPRGIYGGAIGYIGFDGNMDMAIAIRTLIEQNGELLLQAGAGIVEASNPKAEYEETLNKARAALVAIESARRRS